VIRPNNIADRVWRRVYLLLLTATFTLILVMQLALDSA
jgi:hypothetical protein